MSNIPFTGHMRYLSVRLCIIAIVASLGKYYWLSIFVNFNKTDRIFFSSMILIAFFSILDILTIAFSSILDILTKKCIWITGTCFFKPNKSYNFFTVQIKQEMEKDRFWIVNEWSKQSKVAKAKCNKFSVMENWANVYNKNPLYIYKPIVCAYIHKYICSFH